MVYVARLYVAKYHLPVLESSCAAVVFTEGIDEIGFQLGNWLRTLYRTEVS